MFEELSEEKILLERRLLFDKERQRNKILYLERRVTWLEGQIVEINRSIKNIVKNKTNEWEG